MKDQLDYKIRFSEGSDSHFSLQEVDEDNKAIGPAQEPFEFFVFFTACNMCYSYETRLNYEGKLPTGTLAGEVCPVEVTNEEVISAKLIPGAPSYDDFEEDQTFSMFGTNRKVQDFNLSIIRGLTKNNNNVATKNKSEDKDSTIIVLDEGKNKKHERPSEELSDTPQDIGRCYIFGNTYQKFSDEDHGDVPEVINITLALSDKKFDNLKQLVISGTIDGPVTLILDKVSGFYAPYSIFSGGDDIKVLTQFRSDNLVIPENSSIKPPGLGSVGEFSLRISKELSLSHKHIDYKKEMRENIKKDRWLELEKLHSDLAEDTVNETHETVEESYVEKLLLQLQRNEKAVSALKIPIWAGIFLLLIIAIQIF